MAIHDPELSAWLKEVSAKERHGQGVKVGSDVCSYFWVEGGDEGIGRFYSKNTLVLCMATQSSIMPILYIHKPKYILPEEFKHICKYVKSSIRVPETLALEYLNA